MTEQLECRIIITKRKGLKISLGMYCPRTQRYEPLGMHGPDPRNIDRAVIDLKESIERAGHRVTFCERSE